uniref:Uncharacterized protein n=1 Tax=Cucumis melo TaxID=3656 RepID=A0A9I9EAD2_CUCME
MPLEFLGRGGTSIRVFGSSSLQISDEIEASEFTIVEERNFLEKLSSSDAGNTLQKWQQFEGNDVLNTLRWRWLLFLATAWIEREFELKLDQKSTYGIRLKSRMVAAHLAHCGALTLGETLSLQDLPIGLKRKKKKKSLELNALVLWWSYSTSGCGCLWEAMPSSISYFNKRGIFVSSKGKIVALREKIVDIEEGLK